jgi:hypothetical protein
MEVRGMKEIQGLIFIFSSTVFTEWFLCVVNINGKKKKKNQG